MDTRTEAQTATQLRLPLAQPMLEGFAAMKTIAMLQVKTLYTPQASKFVLKAKR
jgi:hypothetical protein